MEIIIIVCLLVIIVLLFYDIFKKAKQKPIRKSRDNYAKKHVNIIGTTRSQNGNRRTITVNEVRFEDQRIRGDSFVLDNLEEEFEIEIPQEELEEIIQIVPDWEEEEEELKRYSALGSEDGLATGVTFEELSAVATLLGQDSLEASLKDTVVNIVHKIEGTDLYTLLENAIRESSKKLKMLLEQNISEMNDSSSSNLRNKHFGNFDIDDFL